MKNKTLIDSFKKAAEGLAYAVREERHVQLALVIAVAVVAASVLVGLTAVQYVAICFAITLVLVAEFLNTAVEKAIDTVQEEWHPLAKIAKDISAAAVVVSIVNAVLVALLIAGERFKVIK